MARVLLARRCRPVGRGEGTERWHDVRQTPKEKVAPPRSLPAGERKAHVEGGDLVEIEDHRAHHAQHASEHVRVLRLVGPDPLGCGAVEGRSSRVRAGVQEADRGAAARATRIINVRRQLRLVGDERHDRARVGSPDLHALAKATEAAAEVVKGELRAR